MTAPRIVILDSDPFSLGALHAPLAAAGYRTLRCRPQDVADAHALVRRARADLVILDRWLTKHADGWAFLRRLWADLDTTHLPAIVVVAEKDALPVERELLRTMGCRVLRRPFDGEALRGAIAAALVPIPAPLPPTPLDPTGLALPSYPLSLRRGHPDDTPFFPAFPLHAASAVDRAGYHPEKKTDD